MSYIRGNSNPECLYIWAGAGGVNICGSFGKPGTIYRMPVYIFHGILRQFLNENRRDENVVKFRGASLICADHKGDGKEFKWRLSYKNWHFDMWEVTLYNLAHQNAFLWKKEV